MAERDKISYENKLKETIIREESELERFKKLYRIDLNNVKIYNLILETENLTVEDIVEEIIGLLKN